MEKNFDELLSKAKPMSEDKAKAAKEVVAKLKAMLGDGLADKMQGLKKVTVASDSEEGLKTGLDMAKDKVDTMDHMSNDRKPAVMPEGSPEEESTETPADEKSEEQKIAELEKQLEELKSKKKGSDLEVAKQSIKSIF